MSTRARIVIRSILVGGVVACFAALSGVARAQLPGTSAAPAVTTVSQPVASAAGAAVPSASTPTTSSTTTATLAVPAPVQTATASVSQSVPKIAPSAPVQNAVAPVQQNVAKTAAAPLQAGAPETEIVAQTAKASPLTVLPSDLVETAAAPVLQAANNVTSHAVRAVTSPPAAVAATLTGITGALRMVQPIVATTTQATSSSRPRTTQSPGSFSTTAPVTAVAPSSAPSAAPIASTTSSADETASLSTPRSHRVNGGSSRAVPAWLSNSTASTLALHAPARASGGTRSPLPDLPRAPFPGAASAGAAGSAPGGSLLAFAALLFGFLLVIPNAVRWLRPALAHGLSPAYVAIGDRPG